jgi:hypothetical protein
MLLRNFHWYGKVICPDFTDEAKKEEEKDNDPPLMPSRYMLLYGSEDGKLRGQGIFEGLPEHEISIANRERR